MKTKKRLVLALLFCCILLLAACSTGGKSPERGSLPGPGHLQVHFIDVGQGDAILIRLPEGETILIDAGDPGQGEHVVRYVKGQGISKIHHLIATHPHADHIGGLPAVILNLDIGRVYMPRATHTTRTYENLLLTLKNKGLKATETRAGIRLETEPAVTAVFVAPNHPPYENLNDYSAVLHLQFGGHAFLFTGDATPLSGQEILDTGQPIKAQVLQIPHHGSSNSAACAEFLSAVSPQTGVISLGSDNPYGHPHREIMELLDTAGIEVWRTDRHGTIVFYSDGQNLVAEPERLHQDRGNSDSFPDLVPGKDAAPPDAGPGNAYIGNANSGVLHRPDCTGLPLEHNRIYFEKRYQALDQGYRPCQNCNP